MIIRLKLWLDQPWNWLVHTEGSSRALALIRITLVINCWARWGDERVLFRNLNPEVFGFNLLFYVSSTLALIGLYTRISTALLALCTGYFVHIVGHVYGNSHYVHHHTILLATACLLLALSPSGRSLSVDRWLALKHWSREDSGKEMPSEVVNLWAMRLMALQVVSIYFWGAYDKCNAGFLSGDRMTHYLMYYYTGPGELTWPGASSLTWALAQGTVLLEFALAFGLLFRRTRTYLIVPGLLLHGIFYATLPVATFTTTMWALYFALFEPDEVDSVITRLLPPPQRS